MLTSTATTKDVFQPPWRLSEDSSLSFIHSSISCCYCTTILKVAVYCYTPLSSFFLVQANTRIAVQRQRKRARLCELKYRTTAHFISTMGTCHCALYFRKSVVDLHVLGAWCFVLRKRKRTQLREQLGENTTILELGHIVAWVNALQTPWVWRCWQEAHDDMTIVFRLTAPLTRRQACDRPKIWVLQKVDTNYLKTTFWW